jgi:cation:H+ antiporter
LELAGLIIGGLILLVLGGEMLVRGAVDTARRMGVSPLLIGLTLVGFGTSTPELVTSLQAAFEGSPGIAVGNVVGSNIANILIILAFAAVIATVPATGNSLRRDGMMVVFTALVCALVAFFLKEFSLWIGVVFLLGLAAYLYVVWQQEKDVPHEDTNAKPPMNLLIALPLVVVGIATTIFGARLLVDGAIDLAKILGMPDTVIGLTIVAVGTSLPELVASTMAALRKHGEIALGNVLGSNIYNILGILGITAVVKPVPAPQDIAHFDVWVMLGVSLLMVVLAFTNRKISRAEGFAMLLLYGVYVYFLLQRTGANTLMAA